MEVMITCRNHGQQAIPKEWNTEHLGKADTLHKCGWKAQTKKDGHEHGRHKATYTERQAKADTGNS
jgi:hypothetical protein